MKNKELARQEISAFADGELKGQEFESALTELRHDERRDDWEMYHKIGDLLRSSDMSVKLSPDFSARMAARLELEPAILAPHGAMQSSSLFADPVPQPEAKGSGLKKRHPKYWFASGIVAAGVAATALIGAPQLMVATSDAPGNEGRMRTNISSDVRHVSNGPATNSVTVPQQGTVNAPDIVMRDSRIDDYLLAHQRFSPSLYGATHYARAATFATDSNK
jgi:sigma-E factor negative regulatory protein RseA